MKLISSEVALRLLVALRHSEPRTLTELAEVIEALPSSVQVGLAILIEDGLVIGEGERKNRRYRLSDGPVPAHLVAIAISMLPLDGLLGIIARAHPAIEFLARRNSELLVVVSEREGPLAEAAAAKALDEVSAHVGGLTTRHLYHDDLRRELLVHPELRTEADSGTVIHGSLDRSFPDRSQHGLGEGERLGRPHPSLRMPSQRRLRRLARRHGLGSMRLFGSAVRSDFRPDSDVDLAVRYRPEVEPTLGSLTEIEHELEHATGRDVEVVQEKNLDPEVREALTKEGVALL